MNTQLLVNPSDVQNSLATIFGVEKEKWLQIVAAGVSGRNSCTPHHPRSIPGTYCWAEATREMRDVLVPLGYELDNTDNIPSVWNKELKIKISVCNSDAGTGVVHSQPQPVRSKGDGAKRAVSPNEGILNLIFESPEKNSKPALHDAESFWYLCIFCGRDDEYRAELCCPLLKEDGSFKDFLYDRILLIDDGNGNTSPQIRRDNPEDAPDFDVPVVRRNRASA